MEKRTLAFLVIALLALGGMIGFFWWSVQRASVLSTSGGVSQETIPPVPSVQAVPTTPSPSQKANIDDIVTSLDVDLSEDETALERESGATVAEIDDDQAFLNELDQSYDETQY